MEIIVFAIIGCLAIAGIASVLFYVSRPRSRRADRIVMSILITLALLGAIGAGVWLNLVSLW